MATSFGFKQFSRRMATVAKLFEGNVQKTVKSAAAAALTSAATNTPVLTGNAASGWFTTTGAPSSDTPDGSASPSSAAGQSVSRGVPAINSWKLGRGPIFITNNVPYIEQLDNGSSLKAPSGMSRAAVLAGRTVLTNAKVLPRR